MNKVLVTGGGHLLDYHVIKRLNERGIRPRSLVLPPPDSDTTHINRLSVDLMGEITAPSDLAAALQGVDHRGVAYKVNPAGTLDAMREANMGGTRTLLDAAEAAGVACVVVTSSATAVGGSRAGAAVASRGLRAFADTVRWFREHP